VSRFAFAVPLLLLAAVVTPARADGTAAVSPLVIPDSVPAQPWYGWQVVAADAASIGFALACMRTGNDGCPLASAGYWLGGPIIHTIHRGAERGAVSLSLRVGLPLAGAVAGWLLDGCTRMPDDDVLFCAGEGAVVGVAIGTVAAIVVDGAWAFDDAPARRPIARVPSLGPTLTFNRDSAGVGLAGRF